mgnify:CR=1 FL=1
MTKNKQLFINLITTLLVLVINTIINFFLSRYIVDYIGDSAYGFISLANNFISYATIFTTAINSMASRFITLNIHKKKEDVANKFFSSVLTANIIIIAVLMIPSIILIIYLDQVINIPLELVFDVKLLFLLIFINFFITLIGGVFTVATYCKNKLYLSSLRNMESTILKFILILILFFIFKPAVFYVGIATLIASVYVLLFNIKYTKQLLPDIKIKKQYFSIEKIKILLSSGLWNSITNLGNVIADGLDLLISNIFVGASTMGIVAVAKVPSTAFNTIISNIITVFQPQALEYYAKDDTENTKKEVIKSMKISGIFGNIPFAYIIVFGISFCTIWMPNMESKILTILCILTFINIFTGGLISPLYNVFTITNKVKTNAILALISAIISTLIVLVFLQTTNLGAYVIVGGSAIIGAIKGFGIVPIYAAKCLNTKWTTFFPVIGKYLISTFIMVIIFFLISLALTINGWITLLISIILCGFIGLLINLLFLLDKEEIKTVIMKFKSKLIRS